MDQWYYLVGQEKTGPVDRNYLEELYKSKTINKDTFLWKKSFSGWTKLGEVEELDDLYSSKFAQLNLQSKKEKKAETVSPLPVEEIENKSIGDEAYAPVDITSTLKENVVQEKEAKKVNPLLFLWAKYSAEFKFLILILIAVGITVFKTNEVLRVQILCSLGALTAVFAYIRSSIIVFKISLIFGLLIIIMPLILIGVFFGSMNMGEEALAFASMFVKGFIGLWPVVTLVFVLKHVDESWRAITLWIIGIAGLLGAPEIYRSDLYHKSVHGRALTKTPFLEKYDHYVDITKDLMGLTESDDIKKKPKEHKGADEKHSK